MRSVNLGRWSRYVERYFNIKGGGGLMDVEQVLRIILPIFTGVEDRSPQSWNRFAIVANVPALAANDSRVRIRNPVGSNVVQVIEQITVSSNVQDDPLVTWGAVTTDLASIVSLTFSRMDPRGNPQPTAIVSFNQQAAGGTPFLQRQIAASSSADYIANPDQQIPNLPGQAIDVQANTANTNMIVSLMWRERPLEASELT